MSKKLLALSALFLLLCPFFSPGTRAICAESTRYLSIGPGLAGIGKPGQNWFINLEFRPKWNFKGLTPWIGLMSSEQEMFIGSGLLLDLQIAEHWFLLPSIGIGGYFEDNGRDLGSDLEFRPALEIDRELGNKARIGLRFSHLSNAGLGTDNPGVDTLSLLYSHPL